MERKALYDKKVWDFTRLGQFIVKLQIINFMHLQRINLSNIDEKITQKFTHFFCDRKATNGACKSSNQAATQSHNSNSTTIVTVEIHSWATDHREATIHSYIANINHNLPGWQSPCHGSLQWFGVTCYDPTQTGGRGTSRPGWTPPALPTTTWPDRHWVRFLCVWPQIWGGK